MVRELNKNHFDDFYDYHNVSGGYYLWLRRKNNKSCLGEISRWASHGIVVAPGIFFNPTIGNKYFRLCFAKMTEKQIIMSINKMSLYV
jgi:aspartate/methionine/tyrosine aminotransferase